MVCTVKMGSYPNFTDGVQWTVRGDGLHGMEHDNSVESWEITGCDNHSVIFFEHGDPNDRQQAHALTDGKYQRYNEIKALRLYFWTLLLRCYCVVVAMLLRYCCAVVAPSRLLWLVLRTHV